MFKLLCGLSLLSALALAAPPELNEKVAKKRVERNKRGRYTSVVYSTDKQLGAGSNPSVFSLTNTFSAKLLSGTYIGIPGPSNSFKF